MFIVLEGADGCGKTTQAKLLAARLQENGHDVFQVADPGTTPVGKRIRELVLDPTNKLLPITQALLFSAARVETAERVCDHVAAGGVVVADRWTLSLLAYQGAQGVPSELLTALTSSRTLGGAIPTHVFILDIEPRTAAARRQHRMSIGKCSAPSQPDRFESADIAFHTQIRDRYLSFAATGRGDLVDVEGFSPPVVHEMLVERLQAQTPSLNLLTSVR